MIRSELIEKLDTIFWTQGPDQSDILAWVDKYAEAVYEAAYQTGYGDCSEDETGRRSWA